ncbi:MAG: hypothetical protein ACYDBH_03045 [Acidobacteriaceae bacterium]
MSTSADQNDFAQLVQKITIQIEHGGISAGAPEAPPWDEGKWQALLIKTQAKREAIRLRVGRREIRKLRRRLGLVR